MNYTIEERQEVCSVASKLVTLKVTRVVCTDRQGEGEIVDFHCNQTSSTCETRCTYRMLLNDF